MNRYMCMYNWITLLYTWNEHNIVNQWYSNIKLKNFKVRVIWASPVPWRRQWHPTPVLLPGKSHGRRSLVGCSPWGHWGSDMTERPHFHFSLSCIGEGNGNPLQCSCLENARDGGAWWAAVYGVAQTWTRLKRLSSSPSALPVKNLPVMQEIWVWSLDREDALEKEMATHSSILA